MVLKNMDFSDTMIADIAAMVDVDGMGYEHAAESWYANNQAVWAAWIPKICRQIQ